MTPISPGPRRHILLKHSEGIMLILSITVPVGTIYCCCDWGCALLDTSFADIYIYIYKCFARVFISVNFGVSVKTEHLEFPWSWIKSLKVNPFQSEHMSCGPSILFIPHLAHQSAQKMFKRAALLLFLLLCFVCS